MDSMADIRATFFQECEEQLIELEAGLLTIKDGLHDAETINSVFRSVHSIKGGAGAFQLDALVDFAHVFENTLDMLRTGRIEPEPALLSLMLRATDALADMVKAGREGSGFDTTRTGEIALELSQTVSGNDAHAAPEEEIVFQPIAIDLDAFDDLLIAEPTQALYRVRFAPRADLYVKGNETGILFRELEKLGPIEVSADISRLPMLDALEPEESYLDFVVDVTTSQSEAAIAEVFEFAAWDSDFAVQALASVATEDAAPISLRDEVAVPLAPELPPPTPFAMSEGQPASISPRAGDAAETHKAAAAAPATIRVDLGRVDRLIDLVGELVINQAMLTERISALSLPRMSSVSIGLDELEQLTREIQDSVMAIRAQPVRSVFQRLPRLVREVAQQTGKSIRLETSGEGTEVDKTVIERLIDPLTHMIRNAIDHGVEKPERRLAVGKESEGALRVSAAHRSGRIVIEIADDGAGIDRERVRSIAVSKGLIAPDAKLTDEEIDNLIFLPGFSTAETISDISGRGVGMDVVRRSIQALGGRISITSTPGVGSTFTLSLPLTLAVLDGMVVTVAQETFVVPLSAVVEILMPQTMTVHDFGRTGRVVGLRGEFIPLIDVGRRLSYRSECTDPARGITLLVEAEGGARSALVVDAIQGQRQVVIKSLEANYSAVRGIAAATILGNGRVALILDIDTLVADTGAAHAIPALPKAS